jgi:EpsI family protein
MIVDSSTDPGPQFSRRAMLAGLLMFGAAGVAAVRKPNLPLHYLGNRKLSDIIPTQIGRWTFVANSGVVVPPEDQLQTALYSDLLTGIYSDGKQAIMLLIAYGANQTGFLQVHRPEFCYTAAGFKLSNPREHIIRLAQDASIRAKSLDAARDGVIERLVYWTRIGNDMPFSWTEQKLTIAEDNLRRIIPDATLVRVSTIVEGEEQALGSVDDFVRALIQTVPQQQRRIFVA